ncbi:MAG: hypothetical protein ABJA66_21870 [Actinomycetota bacterium]
MRAASRNFFQTLESRRRAESRHHRFGRTRTYGQITSYRVDAEDASIRAPGYDVVDFSFSKHITKWMDVNFSVDKVLNKTYNETQQYHESRLRTDAPIGIDPESGRDIYPSRFHITPGYRTTFNFGVTFRLFAKN